MLWVVLRLVRLPLEIFPAHEGPAMTVQEGRVAACNEAAQACGVLVGQGAAAALAVAPGVLVHDRRTEAEVQAMQALACWAGGFTPRVCMAPPCELLLEVRGCLRLFHGLTPLLQKLAEGIRGQGYTCCMAVAPTPLAAQWLARAAAPDEIPVKSNAPWLARVKRLPITVMALPDAHTQALHSMGVRCIGELFMLPAAGLARRFGPGLPLTLAQASGEATDLRKEFAFPERFMQHLELPARVEHAPMLLFGAARLLRALAGWLALRAAGVSECVLWLRHGRDAAPTALRLAFAAPMRDAERMERVLRERLERLALPHPVLEISLEAHATEDLPGTTLNLLVAKGTAEGALDAVLERLRARLGESAVHGLAVQPDYRPECATRKLPMGEAPSPMPGPPRPLWLLDAPRALHEPAAQGLRLMAGPERIESGWWDAGEAQEGVPLPGDCKRDYYVALSPRGEWWWIFRDQAGWWQHGVFA